MKSLHVLATVDEVRAIADPRRISILSLLTHETLTVSQLAERFGEPVGRTHYHLKALERASLVRRVRTREVRGVLEKYYQAIARHFDISPELLRGRARQEVADVALQQLRTLYRESRHAIETIAARQGPASRAEMRRRFSAVVSVATITVTPQELRSVYREVGRVLKRYEKRPAKGRRTYTLWTVGYQADPAAR